MKVSGVSKTDLLEIMGVVRGSYADNPQFKRLDSNGGKWVNFTLRVESSSGQGARVSHSGRKMVSACWHVHRDFMAELFTRFPSARLVSALADYNGKDDFQRKFEATGCKNIGSMFAPLPMDEACNCLG